jgi:transcription-repair coupling factor (superfamily II helicase)
MLDTDKFKQQLETASYRHVSQVFEHGEYAVRGGIIDLFPMGSTRPYRIDLFGDEVDTIRQFDTETQRSADAVNQIELLPAREFPMTEAGINRFRQSWLRATFLPAPNFICHYFLKTLAACWTTCLVKH